MGNISTNLLRFNGEIGPQYLDPDDKTGGPDGTMKPITKDVLREMIVLNLPEIQKVQDEYVKAELESIKQTQQQILQRLNQPINTQLTGSYVEYDVSNDFGTIPAGTNKQVVINVPEGMTKFVLAARVTGIVSEVRYGTSIGGFIPNWSFYKRITENEVFLIGPGGASDGRNWANLVTKKLDLLSNRLIIFITASADGDVSPNMSNDAGIKVYFWGG